MTRRLIEQRKISYRLAKRADGSLERGEVVSEPVYRIIRKSDGKVFKPSGFMPSKSLNVDCYYLEEV